MSPVIRWPSTLVVEVAERRCIPFLGAGVSAGCESTVAPGKRPVPWKAFLEGALPLLRNPADQTAVTELIGKEQYLDAAQVVVDEADRAEFEQYIRSEFMLPKYKPSPVHEILLELDPKIVITTNYDDIYEQYCKSGKAEEGYNVCRYYESHAINDIRSDVRLILKAHGCISDPSKVVLSRSQYFDAKRLHHGFYDVLDALFLTNTLLFVGCGLSDPDIQLVLENANISAPSTHPHYALVPGGRHRALTGAIRKSYNIELLEYPTPGGDHTALITALRELQDAVAAERATSP
ncbi:MAG: SIR2 family protein [Deltaproteobacteria bacterium]|nr:SIR2 family protein [Deltaproteobacteria bacterium]